MRLFRVALLVLVACKGGDLDDFYEPCESPDSCDAIVPEDAEGECIEKEGGGFCAWSCASDDDCAGDQDETWDFVCAPFESNPETYCFPSCLEADDSDAEECPEGFGCRSTGGGGDNRRICFPL